MARVAAVVAFFVFSLFMASAGAAYTDNSDGTVTDPSTGLVWMRCAMGQTWDGTTCTGSASGYTWDQAKALTSNFAGMSDWRLPNIRELQTIVDRSRSNPAIDPAAFPNAPASNFWSASAYAFNSNYAWYVYFNLGGAYYNGKSYGYQVRLVRGGQSLALLSDTRQDADYTDNGDGTVTHKPTGLMWKRCTEDQEWSVGASACTTGTAAGYTWDQAVAQTDSFAGRNDWRLPTEDELLSLVDYTKFSPSTNTAIFPGTPNSVFWSASAYANVSSFAWNVDFGYGYANGNDKNFGYQVRPVRAGQSFCSLTSTPAAPLATAGYGRASVSITAPTGGSAVSGYTVTSNPAGGIDTNAGGTGTSHVVTGLTNGTAYTFTVTAFNCAGTSAPSPASNSVTPTTTISDAPTNVSASDPGNGSATVSFTAPANDGGAAITGYTVTSIPAGGVDANAGSTSTTHTITGLANGTTYSFKVSATNSVGTSAASAASNAVTAGLADNGEGTVTDVTTGLVWMRCAMGQTWSGSACSGTASTYTWDQAKALTSNFAGMSDWRLPNIRELQSIVDRSGFSPALSPVAFPNAPTTGAWSATSWAGSSSYAWMVDFSNGGAGYEARTASYAARLVRGGQSLSLLSDARPDADYADNGDGTMTHTPTGLMWKRCSEGQSWTTGSACSGTASGYSYEQALALSASFAGKSDWRLPTEGELVSLVDYTRPDPALNAAQFPNSPAAQDYWSGSAVAGSTTAAWGVYLGDGNAYTSARASSYRVRQVRAGPSSCTLPAAPAAPAAVAGNGSASVSFSAPASGSTVTGYTVISSPAGGIDNNAGGTSTTHSITGLTAGTAYTFTVTAFNCAGTSAASAVSNGVTPVGVPGAPTNVTATAGTAQASVSFTAPANSGGATITGYTVSSYPAGGVDSNAGSTATTHAVTGLSNGTAYTFTVMATNSAGTSPASTASNSVTPLGAPGAPSSVTATPGLRKATVAFTTPATDGGAAITGYTVTSNPAGGIDNNAGSTALSHTVTGLTNGTAYTFTVTATNSLGTSAPSTASNSVIPAALAGAPTNVIAVGSKAQATVSFTAPANDGGSPITGYTVTASPGGVTATGTSSPVVVKGLGSGTYSFTVTATNSVGPGAASIASNSVQVGYIDNGDGTVTDTAIGLVWMSCALGQTWDGTTCTGTASSYTWDQAKAVTSTFAGKSDWRLPNVRELQTIVDRSRFDPAIDPVAFPNALASFFWSASAFADNSSNAWYVYFYLGYAYNDSKGSALQVRLVRAGQSLALLSDARQDADHTDNGDGTVTHKPTGLMWKRCAEGQDWNAGTSACTGTAAGYTWDQAAAQTASFAGRNDWRLPTEDELLSLVDYTKSSPSTNTANFPGTPGSDFWSASAVASSSDFAWGVFFGDGGVYSYAKGNDYRVRLVRAGQSFCSLTSAPGTPVATVGNGSATVSFDAPTGGSPVSGYTVTSNPAGGIDTNAGSTGTSHVVTGLANGTAYTFTVTAFNCAGTSPASPPSVSVTPAAGLPGTPTIGTATPGNAQASVSFTPPASDGGTPITRYTVTASPGGQTGSGPTSPVTVSGLTNGTSYSFTVTATNSAGTSAPSSASNSVIPAGIPSAPAIGTATAGNGQASVRFTPSSDTGGIALTGYTVKSSPGNITGTGTQSPITVTGLTNGTPYTFTVTATNGLFTSPASAASNSVTPMTVPGAPTDVVALAGNASATVSFAAPANGGSAITGYTVVSSPAGGIDANAGSTALSHTVTGLTNGTVYSFTVNATNAVGAGAASSASNSVTPIAGISLTPASVFPGQTSTITVTPNGASPGSCSSSNTAIATVSGTTVTAGSTTGSATITCGSFNATLAVLTNVPGAPTNVSAAAGNNAATISFTPPSHAGSDAITGYVAICNPGNASNLAAVSPITITGLTNGTSYACTVAASNGSGTGPASAAVNVTPVGQPAVTLSASSLSFGVLGIGGTSSPQLVKLNNTGNNILSMSSIAASGDFSRSTTCGATLPGGGECLILVSFTPTGSGARSGALTVASNAPGSPHTVSLSGTGSATVPHLSALTLTGATLSPAFSAGNTSYTSTVSKSTASITLAASTADVGASIAVNGNALASGSVSAPIALADGVNTITVMVTAADGVTSNAYTLAVTRLAPVTSGGTNHTLAVGDDGGLWAWGYNVSGQLGDGGTTDSVVPKLVDSGYTTVAAGQAHSLGIKTDGSLWAWGGNDAGQLGDATSVSVTRPKLIDSGYIEVAAGLNHSVALKADGSLWAWGSNSNGQLGDGTSTDQLVPKRIATGYRKIATGLGHTLALTKEGALWAWGWNIYGQLGDGSTVDSYYPKLIGTGYVAISAAGHSSMALKADGTLLTWGWNAYGQLGDGTTNNRLTPAQIGTDYTAIAAGFLHTLALKGDGSLWAWGLNNLGQFGDGTTDSMLAPKLIGSGFSSIAVGYAHSLAPRGDGTIWSGGYNITGQLGDGTFATRTDQVLVVNAAANGALDLVPTAAKDIPKDKLPPFWVVTSGGGLDGSSGTLSVKATVKAGDVGRAGEVYITAMVPAGTLVPVQSTSMRSSSLQANAIGAAAPAYVPVQLTPSGWQPVINGQLIPYSTGVLADQLAATNILNGATAGLQGSQFCIGYAGSSTEMLATGNMRVVANIPDQSGTNTLAPSCVPISVADTQAPSVPGGLSAAAVSSSQINLSWTASTDNLGVTAYKIYRGGTLPVTLGNATSYSDTGLAAQTSYSYAVAACDALGNCSEQSAVAAATTQADASATSTSTSTSTTTTASSTTTTASSTTTTSGTQVNVVQGWNLLGNGLNSTIAVASVFGDTSLVQTVWKWIPGSTPGWAFYTPAQGDGGAVYAATKGYAALTTINAGEGFWVNAKQGFPLQLAGSPVLTPSFSPSSGSALALPAGWSLIAVGDNPAPRDFANGIAGGAPSSGVAATSLVTLWAWNPLSTSWYFYAPALDNSGGLAGYTQTKDYLDFGATGQTLSPATGFWVNR